MIKKIHIYLHIWNQGIHMVDLIPINSKFEEKNISASKGPPLDFEGAIFLEQAQDHLLESCNFFLVHHVVIGNGKSLVAYAFSTKSAK